MGAKIINGKFTESKCHNDSECIDAVAVCIGNVQIMCKQQTSLKPSGEKKLNKHCFGQPKNEKHGQVFLGCFYGKTWKH